MSTTHVPRDPHHASHPEYDLRPYFFRRDASDVLQETFEALLTRDRSAREGRGGARDAVSEQRRTMFAHDEFFQRLFDGDFEAFSDALDHPERLHERLARRLATPVASQEARVQWDGLGAPVRAWEAQTDRAHPDEVHDDHHHHHDEERLEDDPVYDRAFRLVCRIDRWGRRLAARLKPEDADLTRILANAILVPAKIAFGFSAAIDDDVPGYEVAVIGYRQAAIFLHRVLESLGACYGKQLGRTQTVHDLLDEGRDLLGDIESRIAEYESEIRYRRDNAS